MKKEIGWYKPDCVRNENTFISFERIAKTLQDAHLGVVLSFIYRVSELDEYGAVNLGEFSVYEHGRDKYCLEYQDRFNCLFFPERPAFFRIHPDMQISELISIVEAIKEIFIHDGVPKPHLS